MCLGRGYSSAQISINTAEIKHGSDGFKTLGDIGHGLGLTRMDQKKDSNNKWDFPAKPIGGWQPSCYSKNDLCCGPYEPHGQKVDEKIKKVVALRV